MGRRIDNDDEGGTLRLGRRPWPECAAGRCRSLRAPVVVRQGPHWLAVACGSVSMMSAMAAETSAAAARFTARVVLPEPPFWLTIAHGGHDRSLSCSHVDVWDCAKSNMWAYAHVCAGSALGPPRNPRAPAKHLFVDIAHDFGRQMREWSGFRRGAKSTGLAVGGSDETCCSPCQFVLAGSQKTDEIDLA